MRGQELRSLGFPGVWFVPGCAGPREVSEPAQQVAARAKISPKHWEGGENPRKFANVAQWVRKEVCC